ncbi:MAG: hypothetical protein AAFW65_03005 [Pseudomonadota bacterium]
MKYLILASALVLSACATGPSPYAPAENSRDKGFSEQVIETGRYRVSYKGDDAEQARSYALLRAAEITIENGADWFRVVDAYTEVDGRRSGGGSSVSVGGSSGSYGSGVGVGVGIGLPLGGGGSPDATHTLEMVIFKGEKPDDPDAYDAASVQASVLGAPLP